MFNLLILIITILVIYLSFKMYQESRSSEVDYVLSKYDQQEYLVRNLPDKNHAAELLSLIKERLMRMINYLKEKYPKDARIIRLYEKFDPRQISESSNNSAYTSYSVNKGEKIVFCLRQRDESEHLMDLNTMIFVAIHELAHIMTESVGHTQEFWENMRFLLNQAMSDDLKIYHYLPYHKEPKPYCGTLISDTPLKL